MMIQSRHNSAHVTTAQLLWLVQNYDMIWSVESKLEHKKCSQEFNHELVACVWNPCISLVACKDQRDHDIFRTPYTPPAEAE